MNNLNALSDNLLKGSYLLKVKAIFYKPVLHVLLVLIVGIAGYSNTLNIPFQFDDVGNIAENPVIKNLDYYQFPETAKNPENPERYQMLINRYIGSLTFALNYKINGLDVTGYHLVNLTIHLINSMLIYWFVQLIFISLTFKAGVDNTESFKYSSMIALFSSMLFVAHPIQTQAVTYIVQRFASLATMFYIFSIIMYVKFRLTQTGVITSVSKGTTNIRLWFYYLASLLSAVLAMKTKEIAFTLPVIIAIFEFLFFEGNIKNRIRYLVPLLLTMLIIPATQIYLANMEGGTGSATRLETNMSRLDYLFTEFRVIITYIRLLFFPIDQNLDYDYPHFHSLFEPEVFLSFMSLLIISSTVIYLFWRYKKTLPLIRIILFGTAWFFATLSIESSLIPIVDVIFEHRVYLPSLGLFLVISVLSVMVVERYRQKWVKNTITLSFLLMTLVLVSFTYSRNNVWRDKISLMQDVVSKSPSKERGFLLLGEAYMEKGDFLGAVTNSQKATVLDPSDFRAHVVLGISLDETGRTDAAVKEFKEALRLNPHLAEAHNSLGIVLAKLGQTKEAIEEFREACRINPDSEIFHKNLGMALGEVGQRNEALDEYRKAENNHHT